MNYLSKIVQVPSSPRKYFFGVLELFKKDSSGVCAPHPLADAPNNMSVSELESLPSRLGFQLRY